MSAHRSLINKLLLACAAMFAFGFALVPLYDVFCDITGINGKTDKVAAAAPDPRRPRARGQRRFLATHDPAVAVDFAPETARLRLNPGAAARVLRGREPQRPADRDHAVPSVSPGEAARHFMKIRYFWPRAAARAGRAQAHAGAVLRRSGTARAFQEPDAVVSPVSQRRPAREPLTRRGPARATAARGEAPWRRPRSRSTTSRTTARLAIVGGARPTADRLRRGDLDQPARPARRSGPGCSALASRCWW